MARTAPVIAASDTWAPSRRTVVSGSMSLGMRAHPDGAGAQCGSRDWIGTGKSGDCYHQRRGAVAAGGGVVGARFQQFRNLASATLNNRVLRRLVFRALVSESSKWCRPARCVRSWANTASRLGRCRVATARAAHHHGGFRRGSTSVSTAHRRRGRPHRRTATDDARGLRVLTTAGTHAHQGTAIAVSQRNHEHRQDQRRHHGADLHPQPLGACCPARRGCRVSRVEITATSNKTKLVCGR